MNSFFPHLENFTSKTVNGIAEFCGFDIFVPGMFIEGLLQMGNIGPGLLMGHLFEEIPLLFKVVNIVKEGGIFFP